MSETQTNPGGKENKGQPSSKQSEQPQATTPGNVPPEVATATSTSDQMRALAGETSQSKELETRPLKDPHVAYVVGVKDMLQRPDAPGLSVLNLKGLVARVFTSGEVFPADDDPQFEIVDPRLDFQPIMATFSDTMQQKLGTEMTVIGNRFFSLDALAKKLGTTSADAQNRLRGKTHDELDPQLQALMDESRQDAYDTNVQRDVIDPEIAALGKGVEKTPHGQTPPLADIDLTTISRPYPDRQLTNVETRYLQLVKEVAESRQTNSDGTDSPIGLSETYLYDIWQGLLSQNSEYVPRVDFDPVVTALSPTLRNTTGTALVPRMQLYAETAISPLPPLTQLPTAPEDVMELLDNYDNVKTEETIARVVGGSSTP